jgi:hypothetical protein
MKHIILFLSVFAINLGFSQIDEITYGQEYLKTKKSAFNGFIGETDMALFGADYVYISKKKHTLNVTKYSKGNLSLIETKDIYTNPKEDYYNKPLELFFVDKQFYLFSEFTNLKEKKTVIGLFIYNENLVEQQFTIIDTIEKLEITDIDVKMADDKSGFAFLQTHNHKVANRQVVEIKSIDLNGSVLWKKELLSSNSVHKIKVEKVIHTKNETYMLCNYGYRNYEKNTTNNQNILANKYTLWVYNPKLNFLKDVVLRLKGKWINGVDISLNKSTQLIIAGYANSSRDFGINATFNVHLNSKYEPKQVNYFKFKKEDFAKFVSVKDMNKIKDLDDMFLRDLVIQDDGSFYLIGETYYKYVDRNYDPRTNITTTTDHYNYNSVIVSYFNAMGELMWHEHIPKFQNTTNDFGYHSSIAWMPIKDKLILFYNGNEKNLELNVQDYFNHKDIFNNRRHSQTYVVINKNGISKRSKLNKSKTNYLLYPRQSLAINNHTMYLMSEYDRHSKIISITFK